MSEFVPVLVTSSHSLCLPVFTLESREREGGERRGCRMEILGTIRQHRSRSRSLFGFLPGVPTSRSSVSAASELWLSVSIRLSRDAVSSGIYIKHLLLGAAAAACQTNPLAPSERQVIRYIHLRVRCFIGPGSSALSLSLFRRGDHGEAPAWPPAGIVQSFDARKARNTRYRANVAIHEPPRCRETCGVTLVATLSTIFAVDRALARSQG